MIVVVVVVAFFLLLLVLLLQLLLLLLTVAVVSVVKHNISVAVLVFVLLDVGSPSIHLFHMSNSFF